MMLTYSFTDIGSDSLYEHLYKCIKNDILCGTLAAGEKLPSKRNFAKNLGISVITVENAYARLIAEGYIYSLPKKGFYVSEIKNSAIQQRQEYASFTDTSLPSHSTYLADFTSNYVPADQFPFSIWSKILRDVLHDNPEELLQKPSGFGLPALRRSISEYLQAFRGMNVNPDQIIIGAGTEYLYGLIVQLLGRDLCYAVEDPSYPKIAMIYQLSGAKCVHIPLENSGIRIHELEKSGADVAHISPSHHFPTGIITPVSKRYELLGWATKNRNRYIVEDDYDSEFRMVGKPLPTLRSIDTTEKVIYMNTFSKSMTATMRVSYMVLPMHLVERYRKNMTCFSCPVSTLIQTALSKFMDSGSFERHINRMRQYYKKQRDLIISEIKNSKMNDYVEISEADAGLHFIIHIKTKLSDTDFKNQLLRRKIKISPLSEYYATPENKTQHKFIINYSSLTAGQIREAIAVISEEVTSAVKQP